MSVSQDLPLPEDHFPPVFASLRGVCQILQTNPSGMILVDAQDAAQPIVWANRAFEQMSGYSFDEVRGQNCRFLQGEDRQQPEAALIRQALATQTPCIATLRNYRKDGSMFWNELRISPLKDDNGIVTHFIGIQNDVTQQRQAQETLREQEARLRVILNSTRTGTWEWDISSSRVVFNERWANIIGYTLEELAPLSLKTWERLVHPDDLVISNQRLQAHFNGETEYYECEARMRHKNGEWVWILDRGMVVERDADGAPLRIVGTHTDITKRKQMEAKLQEQHDELEHFFNGALDLLCIANTEGKFLRVNKEWENVLGYGAEMLEGQDFLRFVHPDDLQPTLDALQRLDAQQPILNFTNRYRSANGDYHFIEWRSFPVGERIYAAARDISARLNMEKALQLSEERYRGAIEATLDAFYMLDAVRDDNGAVLDFAFVASNAPALKQMQISHEALIGSRLCELYPFNLTNGFFEQYKAVLETGVPLEQEYEVPAGYPAEGWYYHQVVRVGDGIAIMNRNITERKQHERVLKSFLDDMRALQTLHLELVRVEDLNTLYKTMIQIAHEQLGIKRIGLFLLSADGKQLQGTYGIDKHGNLRDEHYYYEAIDPTHWSHEVLRNPQRTYVWQDTPLYDDGVMVGYGWRAAAALWNGESTLGYFVADNFIGAVPPRAYELELLSILGSTFGYHIERNQAQQRLREREALLQAFINQSNDGIVLVDDDGNVLEWNPAQESITGVPRELACGLPLWEAQALNTALDDRHTLAQQKQFVAKMVQDALQDKPAAWMNRKNENRIRHYQDGTEHFVQSVTFPIKTPHGTMLGSILRDITVRKQIEDSLRASEARQRAMLEAIPDLIFRNHADGTYLDYHAPDENQLYRDPSEFLGKRIDEVFPPLMAKIQMERMAEVLKTGKIDISDYPLMINGEMRRFESRMTRVNEEQVLSMVRDITELRRTQEALHFTNERLAFSADMGRIAWWDMDVESGKVTFDPRKVYMLGYDLADFQDVTYHAFTTLVHPDDQEPMMNAMRQLFKGESALYAIDYRILRADGAWMWFHDRGQLFRSDEGRSVVRGFVIDITERKEIMQKEIALTLEKDRVHLLMQFIETASHEFRTPLATINASAFLMTRLEDPEKRAQKHGQIQSQVMRITRLLDMLLMMARLQNTQELTGERLHIDSILDAATHYVSKLPMRENIIFERAQALPMVFGNPDYLMEAFLQLLDNAIQFTSPDEFIWVRSGATDAEVWLEVQDNGTGIPPESLAHIFETFWRQDRAHTTAGFGLGLSIAKQVMSLHGGRIEVESELRRGSCFRMVLPIV